MIVKILGPARSLLRSREQLATVRRVEGLFACRGPAHTVTVVFELVESSRKISLELSPQAWEQIRERVDRAFVFSERD